MASDLSVLAETLNQLAVPAMKPKDLLKAAREKHPDASKKELVRAAFYALIAHADDDPEKASRLQALGILERAAEDEADLERRKTGKRKKRKE